MLPVVSAFHQMNLLLHNIFRLFFQAPLESFDLIRTQRNVHLGNLRACHKLAQSVDEDRCSAKLSKLLGRGGPLTPGTRSRRHSRPQARSRNDYDHLHSGLQVYEGGTLSSKSDCNQ